MRTRAQNLCVAVAGVEFANVAWMGGFDCKLLVEPTLEEVDKFDVLEAESLAQLFRMLKVPKALLFESLPGAMPRDAELPEAMDLENVQNHFCAA